MKILFILGAFFLSNTCLAGGTIGGGVGSLTNMRHERLDDLPKAYLYPSEFRRTEARLSTAEAKSTSVMLEGEQVEVTKLGGRIVNIEVSKEILSDDSR